MRLTGCEATCDPTVTAQIEDSAGDAQVRKLASDSASYLAKQSGLRIDLNFHAVTVTIDKSASATSALTDSLLTLIHDPKVTRGIVSSSQIFIQTAKDQLVSVYEAHSADRAGPISVGSNPGTGLFSVQGNRLDTSAGGVEKCATNNALLTVTKDLLSDPAVTALSVSMCGDTDVEASDFPTVNRVAAKLQLLTSEPALVGNKFSVKHDGDTYTSVHVVTAATASYASYLEFLNALPGVTEYGTDVGKITVGPVDLDRFTAVMTAIDAEPRPVGVSAVTVRSASGAFYTNGDGTLPQQLILKDAVSNLGTGNSAVATYVTPSELNFIMAGYTTAKAHQLVDAIMVSGLWRTKPTKIEVRANPGAFTARWDAGGGAFTASDSDGSAATQKLITDLGNYWAAKNRS